VGALAGPNTPAADAGERFTPLFTNGLAGFMATVGFVFVSYAGLTKVASVSEEVRNPDRNIPLGMILSLVTAAFIYTAAAALRLARFNAQVETAEKSYFRGLPSPSAAGVLAGLVWAATDMGFPGEELVYLVFVFTIGMGVLMVSNIRYFSFKEFNFKHRVSFVALLLVVMAYVFASIDPPKVLFAGFFIYSVSGIVYTLVLVRRRRRERRRGERSG